MIAQPIAAEPVHKAKGESEQWSAQDQELISWFESYLGKLNDTARSMPKYTRLKQEIAQGPTGTTAKIGALQQELRVLKWVLDGCKLSDAHGVIDLPVGEELIHQEPDVVPDTLADESIQLHTMYATGDSDETAELIEWFLQLDEALLPVSPFKLSAYEQVISNQFYTSLQDAIKRGTSNGRYAPHVHTHLCKLKLLVGV